jgi:dihydropteroate synthase
MSEVRSAQTPRSVRAARRTRRTREACELALPNGEKLALGGDRPVCVMGILNVTPDSFSDGGMFRDVSKAVAHAEEMAAEGAGIIDIGGESTRPGAEFLTEAEQIARVIPVIQRLAARLRVPISIDTTRAGVALQALDAGAQIVNDISALRQDAAMAPLVAKRGAPVVLMHMQGQPRNMQKKPVYRDVVAEVRDFLAARIAWAVEQGIDAEQIIVDPGFGFGKSFEHNMSLLRELDALRSLSRPILVGTSRKGMLGHILGVPPAERVFGTAATVAAAAERGAAIVRVHDVRSAVHVVKVMAAIQGKAWN